MIEFKDDGVIIIDFPDVGPVTVKPPKYGQYKRIRAERERLVSELFEQIAALPDLPSPPPETTDGSQTERLKYASIVNARVSKIQEMTADALFVTWHFILVGDDTFVGLGTPKPPEAIDDWPTSILVDESDTEIVGGVRVRKNPPLIDQAMSQWGKGRWPSGPNTTG